MAEKVDIYCSIDLDSMKKTTVAEPEDSMRFASKNMTQPWRGKKRKKQQQKENKRVY